MNNNNLQFLKRHESLELGDYMSNGYIDSSKIHRLYDYISEYLVVSFFSTSCAGCLPAIEGLGEYLKKHPDTNSLVLFDSTDENIQLLKNHFNGNTLVYNVSKKIMQREFSVYGVPSIFLLNELGQVLFAELGYSNGTYSDIENLMLRIRGK
ncbi:hypothetical protein [Bacillus sp. SM2101]|uniref:peroxiredoxin family protein n=1 Tax=Bacillus sp. SM2101 TaxID=2805366 RepID=UPI001BDF421F|nr:hypothetical protein [Bacillus sp. SM2101]